MCYAGFAECITVHYGIIVVNWPLPKFTNPSSLSTRTEAEILWNAWQTDTAHFYRMTGEEYTGWYAKYQDTIASSGPQPESTGTGVENGAGRAEEGGRCEGEEAPGNEDVGGGEALMGGASSSAAPAGSLNLVFHMNVVTNGSGGPIAVEKRARKVRSDKGKWRKKQAAGSENVGVAG